MENINKQTGLGKISEVPGAIKEIEHENSSEDVSSENEKSHNESKNSNKKSGSAMDSQVSKKLEDLEKKLDLKNSEDETEKRSSEPEKEKEKGKEDKGAESGESSEDEGAKNGSKSVSNTQYQEIKEANFHSIEEYYAELRKVYNEKNQYKDPEFSDVKNFFGSEDDERNLSDIGFDRIVYDDNKVNFFVYENSSNNLDYEFKIKRGIMKDRYFLGAFLMLFRRREEFFTDLILDPQHLEENINAGFIGFTFFINGEWKNVTIDTTVPRHGDEISLSNIETKTHSRGPLLHLDCAESSSSAFFDIWSESITISPFK